MTREEASFILANIDRRVCDDELSEALNMAIKALDQEPCEDAVSRKDVINLILEDAVRTGTRHRYTSNQNMNNEINEVRVLPSVTPTQEPILEKIRVEIEQEHNRLSALRADETLELGECLGLKMALKIIDKYKAESEEL